MNNGTGFYGIGRILLEHAGLPSFFPLTVAVQHGWLHTPTNFEASGCPREIWVWSSKIGRQYREQYPDFVIREVGAPFCYLAEKLKIHYPPRSRSGSIVIPMHSSHYIHASFSAEEYSEMLCDLEDKYHPITVMLYYLDMNEETVAAYKNKGFSVVSNGSLFDHNFLTNFYMNVYDKKYCIFNKLGSGALYAGYLGLNLINYGPQSKVVNRGDKFVSNDYFSEGHTDYLLNNLSSQEIARELGVEHLKTTSALRDLILSNYTVKSIVRLGVKMCRSIIRYVLNKFPMLLGVM